MDADLKWLTDPTVFRVNRLDVRYFGMEGRPELPLFGLRFATPVPIERVEWVGLSGETYPDRKKRGIFGTYSEVPHIADYLVPQECGCHMDTHQMILRLAGLALTIQKDAKPFAFSAIPYTPQQLSEAFHADELPVPCRTVVTLCGVSAAWIAGEPMWKKRIGFPLKRILASPSGSGFEDSGRTLFSRRSVPPMRPDCAVWQSLYGTGTNLPEHFDRERTSGTAMDAEAGMRIHESIANDKEPQKSSFLIKY